MRDTVCMGAATVFAWPRLEIQRLRAKQLLRAKQMELRLRAKAPMSVIALAREVALLV